MHQWADFNLVTKLPFKLISGIYIEIDNSTASISSRNLNEVIQNHLYRVLPLAKTEATS